MLFLHLTLGVTSFTLDVTHDVYVVHFHVPRLGHISIIMDAKGSMVNLLRSLISGMNCCA